MTRAYTTTEEIKKDVEDLANIIMQDGISINEISMMYQQSAQGTLKYIEPHLKHTIVVSDIIGRNIISRRFADKVLFLFGKYEDQRDITLLLECTLLLCKDHIDNNTIKKIDK